MDNFMKLMNKKLAPIARWFDKNRYLDAIKNGFYGVMPFLIIGSFLLVFANLPIDGYADFMASIFGVGWDRVFTIPFDATMNIMTLYVIFAIARSLASHYKINDINAALSALVAFIILTPFIEDGAGISAEAFGASGLFLGILTAILTVEILKFVIKRDIVIKMPASVPANISSSFTSLLPSFAVVMVFVTLRIGFEATSWGTVQNFIYSLIQAPLSNVGGSLPWMIFMNLFACLLWAFGIHGTVILGAIMDPIWIPMTAANAAAYAAGSEIPNIVNTEFQSNFVQLGGTGCTIGLVICMVIFAKSKQYKTMGKLSAVPSIFNINEPVIFGTPIVLNPIMLVPFVLGTVAAVVITYVAMASGLVPLTNGAALPWTIPPIISGFLLSGWQGAALQIFTIAVTTFIWFPFFKIADNNAQKLELGEAVDVEE
ncbi:PTS sugar transporter subunit IIC [Breznakia pachnodae]|uniref:Permease IIC component n=1 Tax=Breznakia pachnodae TaxID=265178 RepID=A0ABU0E0I5_9FIRM|nr:PTS sugar transporter subunit IIC [Breznakia pachnodae]MDQ0360407.1 PTS system cellobiose-specific IIC component [Breznakia pachnodae]